MLNKSTLKLTNLKTAEILKPALEEVMKEHGLKISINPPYIDILANSHFAVTRATVELYTWHAAEELEPPSEEEVLL